MADSIVFEGERANPYPWFAAADIYVQTSRFEGFGLTLAEARVLGRPVGATPPSSHPALRGLIAANAAAESNNTALTESHKVNQLICDL